MTPSVAARWDVGLRDRTHEGTLARALGMHPLTAAVLRHRGITEPEAIREFLNPSLAGLHDPLLLPDMARAVERVMSAIEAHEPILIHGDYDADGVTSAALLVRSLERLGGEVCYFIPHRDRDSHGLGARAVTEAAAQGVRLVIAVDCGVTDYEGAEAAREAGADLIILDHHEPGDHLPEAVAVVAPKRADSAYPFSELAGVGLAFKLASAVCERKGVSQDCLQRAFLDLVAVGTIADVAPLTGENRTLTWHGLRMLQETRKVGLQALMRMCNLSGTVRASDVGYRIGPRLNAAGRMADGTAALELLLTDDNEEALRLARDLDDANRQRQHEQELVFRAVMKRIGEDIDLDSERVIVIAGEDWHIGVLGIVAAKVLEAHNRPALLLTYDGDNVRGSARSIEGFDITAALTDCADLLNRYGGHALAAGASLESGRLPELRERLNAIASERPALADLTDRIVADVEVDLGEIDAELIASLACLEPCGQENPPPLFVSRGVEVLEMRRVGSDGQHLKLYVTQSDSAFDTIGFGLGAEADWLKRGERVDICYQPEMNDYNGRGGLQLRLEAIRPATGGDAGDA